MKEYDEVKVINDNDYYNSQGVFAGMVGRIIQPEIRDNSFLVCFIDPKFSDPTFDFSSEENIKSLKNDILLDIKISDLELVKEGMCSDKDILDELPKNNPKWWCKVENGYIMNLLGEKKNKAPYDYDS